LYLSLQSRQRLYNPGRNGAAKESMQMRPQLRSPILAVAIGITCALAFQAWEGQSTAAQGSGDSSGAIVRFVHVAPRVGAVDINVDGVAAARAIDFKGIADLRNLSDGLHAIRIVSGNGDTVAEYRLETQAGQVIELALFPDRTMRSFDIDISPLRRDQSRIRLIHASLDLPVLSLRTRGISLAGELGFGRASPYATLGIDTYHFDIVVPVNQRARTTAWRPPAQSLAARLGLPARRATTAIAVESGEAHSVYAIREDAGAPIHIVTVETAVRGPRSVTLRDGSCNDPNAAVVANLAPLAPVLSGTGNDQPPVDMSVTTLRTTFETILAGTQSVRVEQTDDEGNPQIICGVIEGPRLPGDGAIAIALRDAAGSADAGVAYISPTSTGESTLTVFLGDMPDETKPKGSRKLPPGSELVAAFHNGSCETVDRVPTATIDAETIASVQDEPANLRLATGRIDSTIAEMVSRHQVVVIRAESLDGRPIVACGEILGVRRGDGSLIVALSGRNGYDIVGIAFLAPRPDGSTTISLFLNQSPGPDPSVRPSSQQGSSDRQGAAPSADEPASAPMGSTPASGNPQPASAAPATISNQTSAAAPQNPSEQPATTNSTPSTSASDPVTQGEPAAPQPSDGNGDQPEATGPSGPAQGPSAPDTSGEPPSGQPAPGSLPIVDDVDPNVVSPSQPVAPTGSAPLPVQPVLDVVTDVSEPIVGSEPSVAPQDNSSPPQSSEPVTDTPVDESPVTNTVDDASDTVDDVTDELGV
jgi:hypothetical protein